MKLAAIIPLLGLILVLDCVLSLPSKLSDKVGKRPKPDREIKGKGGKLRKRMVGAMKKGGRINMRKEVNGVPQETTAIAAYITRVCELDKDGKPLKGNGTKRHCIKRFQDENCEISTEESRQLQNLNATYFNVSCTLANSSATVLVEVYIFEAGGDIDNGDESVIVSEGAMKINIQIEGWKFCGKKSDDDDCYKDGLKEEGASLSVGFFMGADDEEDDGGQGKKRRKPKRKGEAPKSVKKSLKKKMERYEIEDGVVADVSNTYDADGQMIEMDSPKIEDDGSFQFKFKKCRKLIYDPMLDYQTADDSGVSSNLASVVMVAALAFLALVF